MDGAPNSFSMWVLPAAAGPPANCTYLLICRAQEETSLSCSAHCMCRMAGRRRTKRPWLGECTVHRCVGGG